MLSELLQKKLTTHFQARDLDGDGYVEQQDWEQCARNLADLRGWAPASADYQALVAKHLKVWETFWEPADRDGDGKVSLPEYLELAETQRSKGVFATDLVVDLFGTIFDTIDRDGDGEISRAEYRAYFRAWGLSEERADQAFSHLDLNDDDRLSRSSFVQFSTNFYLSDESFAPGNWLFGPYE